MTLSLRVVQVAVRANIELKEAKVQIEDHIARMSYTVREREEQYAQEMKKLQVKSRTCMLPEICCKYRSKHKHLWAFKTFVYYLFCKKTFFLINKFCFCLCFLQEDIQAKTAQVKQYKKQVDQFREQVEVGKEQAQIHKAQVS